MFGFHIVLLIINGSLVFGGVSHRDHRENEFLSFFSKVFVRSPGTDPPGRCVARIPKSLINNAHRAVDGGMS
jgi:hypothetical protein